MRRSIALLNRRGNWPVEADWEGKWNGARLIRVEELSTDSFFQTEESLFQFFLLNCLSIDHGIPWFVIESHWMPWFLLQTRLQVRVIESAQLWMLSMPMPIPIPEQLKKANWEHLMVSVQVIGMSSNIRNSLVEPPRSSIYSSSS